MAYGDFKGLPRRTAFDKMLHDKGFNVAKNPKFDGYWRVLIWWFINIFDKKSSSSGGKIMPKQQSSEELH